MFYFLQKLLSSVKTMEPDVDSLGDQAQAVAQSTSEPRVTSSSAQLTSRFTTLLNNVKVSLNQEEVNCEDRVPRCICQISNDLLFNLNEK